jgi:hypothetical protein
MNWSKVWFGISLVGVASLVFALGYAFGNRVWFSTQTPTEVVTTHWNGAVANNLENIKFLALFGRSSETETKQVGTLMVLASSDKLSLLVRVDTLPVVFGTADKQLITPLALKIYRAQRSGDGNSYITNQVGTITLEQQDKQLKGKFPITISLDNPLSSIERLVFLAESGSSELPIATGLDFLPSSVRTQNAPYLWSENFATIR